MELLTYLDERGVDYKLTHHPVTYTAQKLAETEHVSGKMVIKPVLVQADDRFVLCAVPASRRVDLNAVQEVLHAKDVRLADEEKLQELFPDCEVGAEPPIGLLYGIQTIMDDSLTADRDVMFQACTHQDAVMMSMEDFQRIAQPEIAPISAMHA
jgi:Ala-tRNA(Pro) deacylase